MPRNSQRSEGPWPHRVAVMLVCATFPLIWVGGLVTSYDAGMAVPDWPSTYGYNLFAYPWTIWLFGPWDLFIEHGHRLLGALAGMITIVLVIVVFRGDRRIWVRWLSLATFVAVVVQGLLGGARVVVDQRQVAMLHGITGPVFFAMATAMAVVTSRWWHEAQSVIRDESTNDSLAFAGRRMHRLGLLTVMFAYLQLVIGAQLRHVPADASPSRFNVALMFHLVMALVVTLHIGLLTIRIWKHASPFASLRRQAITLCGLVITQLALGSATWVVKYGWPSWMSEFDFAASHVNQATSLGEAITVTAHVATGSLILVVALAIFLKSVRLFPISQATQVTRLLPVGWIA